MREVGCTVDWIDIPAVLRLKRAARSLFAVDAVVRQKRSQPLADQLFARPVGFGHQVHIALVLGRNPAFEVAADQPASL